MLVVADQRGGLALYAVAPGSHAATLVRRLEGETDRVVMSVSLSSGASPAACVIWRAEDRETETVPPDLWCYRPGAVRGGLISRRVYHGVAVRADGHALAFAELDANRHEILVLADLSGDKATVRRRLPYAENLPPEGGLPQGMGDLDWIDNDTLAITGVGDSDEGEGLCVTDLARPRQSDGAGFGRCLKPGPAEERAGYAHFEQAVPVSAGVVVVVERGQCCFEAVPRAGRAVRLRLSDGVVLGVVATPREGREVVDVSGGGRAVLYTTARDRKELVVSLRWAGESRGAPVTGLPADLILATAQP